MRALIRTAAEVVATGTGLAALARRLQDSTAVLAYHNVVRPEEAGHGDASLHLTLPAFVRQIERLERTHRIVDLPTAASAHVSDGGRPLAVITFDDAYRGAVTLALPELARRSLPATVFVCPGLVGSPSTWWDELGETGSLTPDVRRSAFEECGGRRADVLERFSPAAAGAPLPETYALASAEELRRHCGDGIALGSHAWAHEHLPSLEPGDLERNLRRTLDWLRGFGVPFHPWLALPYGAGSPELGEAALSAGHRGVFGIAGGLWRKGDHRSRVPRVNVPAGLSLRGLELRASGLLTR